MTNNSNSSEQFVDIQEIRGPIVIHNDGSLRAVISARSINFDLKSVEEQNAIIAGFQAFLNAVDFPVQIVIRSKKLDIKPYLKSIAGIVEHAPNDLLRLQAVEYTRFVEQLSQLSHIMQKRFYIVIPYYVIESQLSSSSIKERLKNLFFASSTVPKLTAEQFDRYVTQLDERIAMVRSSVERLGVTTSILNQDDLVDLYYSYYNSTPK